MRRSAFLSTFLAASVALTGLAATAAPASAATGGQLDVVLTDVNGKVDPVLGAGLYRDGVGPDGTRLATKVAACTPNVSDGVCTFSNVEPGKYIVESGAWQEADGTTKTFYKAGTTGTADGFAASALTIRDDSYTEIRIQRQRGVTITGKISGETGVAAGGVMTAHTRTPLADTPTLVAEVAVKPDATYTLAGLPSTDTRILSEQMGTTWDSTWFGNVREESAATVVRGTPGQTITANVQLIRSTHVTINVKVGDTVTPVALHAYRQDTSEDTPTWVRVASTQGNLRGRDELRIRLQGGGVYRFRADKLDGTGSIWVNQAKSLPTTDDVFISEGASGGVVVGAAFDLTASATDRAASTITLEAPATTVYGQTLQAKIAIATSAPSTTGTHHIRLYDGDELVGENSREGAGVVTIPVKLTPGTHTLRAHFTGTSTARSSYSVPVTITVKRPATIAAKPTTPLRAGRTGKITVTVKSDIAAKTGSTPTGTITIKYGSTKLGTAKLTAASKGRVTVPIKALKAGKRSLTISYSGSATVEAEIARLSVTHR